MSNLSDLLNPAPASSPKPASEAPNLPSHYSSDNGDAVSAVARTTYDAASALTALAHSSPSVNTAWGQRSPPTHAPRPQLPSEGQYTSRRYSDGRPGSSYGIAAAPVEPSPPLERFEPPSSPTLEQYHHWSKSPREQRRQSEQARYSPRLAPIQGLGLPLSEQVIQEPDAHNPETSVVTSPPTFNSDQHSRKHSVNEMAVNEEPSHTSVEPPADQLRQPSPTAADTKAGLLQRNSSLPETAPVSSPITHIKPEPSATPRENTPAAAPSLDPETLKAVEALKNEHGLRGSGARKQSSPSVPAMPAETKPAITTSKKRPAPRSTKKGTAAVKKPTNKKRKIDTAIDTGSPTATPTSAHPTARSATPSSHTSKTPAFRGGTAAAAAPPSSSPAPVPPTAASADSAGSVAEDYSEDEDGATDDNTRYCICRRPDNHTWMIACDGGCEDWFHGKCVNIAEADGDLIDTYICPNCRQAGRGNTTWKAMCRRDGCRRPARVGGRAGSGKRGGRGGGSGGERSKYCSEECGVRFFREKLGLEEREGLPKGAGGKRGGRERRKSNFTEPTNTTTTSAADEDDAAAAATADVGSRGGALCAGEVAALVDAVPDLASFRALGDGVLSPPATIVEPLEADDGGSGGNAHENATSTSSSRDPAAAFLTAPEQQTLAGIAARKEALRGRHALLKARERFIAEAKERHGRVAAREGVEPKQVCGYDARLSWGDAEFGKWVERRKARTAAKQQQQQQDSGSGDVVMANGDGAVDGVEDDGEGEVCMKKKCARHSNWKQLVLQDVRFEVADVGDEMRRVDKEEREMRERAMVRWREKVNGGGNGAWVEVVGGGGPDGAAEAKDDGDALQLDTEQGLETAA
ncbi:MAG: hypothetical protein M1821_006935 [Bathelium mastoideum]|nr:MAG: hypothetical protein M1821_006935 [Bathelium mastoideum]